MAVGQVSRGTAMGSAISSQSSTCLRAFKVDCLERAAYEPMLERHLGLPVVLSFANPDGMTPDKHRTTWLPRGLYLQVRTDLCHGR